MATARDLITAALQEIGVLAASETPTAEDASTSLTRLNRFIDTLATERQAIYTVSRTQSVLPASTTFLTVGSGGNFNMARPVHIEGVLTWDINISPLQERPLRRLTEAEWLGLAPRDLTSAGMPEAFYYNPTYPLGNLYLWPITTTAPGFAGAIYAWTAVTQLASLDTSISMPPGYEEMLLTNLALLLCPSFERQPHPVLVKRAAETMGNVKRANQRLVDMSFESAALGQSGQHGYSIQLG